MTPPTIWVVKASDGSEALLRVCDTDSRALEWANYFRDVGGYGVCTYGEIEIETKDPPKYLRTDLVEIVNGQDTLISSYDDTFEALTERSRIVYLYPNRVFTIRVVRDRYR